MKLIVQHQHTPASFTCQLQAPGGTIGRGEQNDLNLPDDSGELSSLQAIIRIDENRKSATLLNMSSMGRVAVNNTPLGLSQETPVNEGDRIEVCDYLIVVDKPQAATTDTLDSTALSATPYDTAAFTATAAGAAILGSSAAPASVTREPSAGATADPSQLPSWHPAYQPAGPSSLATTEQADPYPQEHPLGTPINRMPPAAPAVSTTVAPMPGTEAARPIEQNSAPASQPQEAAPAAPPEPPAPAEDPDDIFKDLLSGPGVLPVGGATADDRHPFDMESATNRNHHNPVELLRPEGLHHPSIDGDPLQALPTDGAEKDRQTIFTDDSPTTLRSDTALDSHKEDNILDTLHRAVHAGYKDKNK